MFLSCAYFNTLKSILLMITVPLFAEGKRDKLLTLVNSAPIKTQKHFSGMYGGLTQNEEVPRERLLVEIVVRQIKNFQRRESTETAREVVQPIHSVNQTEVTQY